MDAVDEDVVIEPIHQANSMEEAAQRYWRASRIWRDKEESDWTTGTMIQELRALYCYRGIVPMLAYRLMDDVVHDRRQHILNLQPEQQVQVLSKDDQKSGS